MVENRLVGIKSREIYEAPAAVVLHAAHQELESLVIARDLERIKHAWRRPTPTLVYNGLWFSQTREAIDAFVAAIQPRVTGVVRLKLFKGDCRVVGRKSPFALYDHGLATYDSGDRFDHSAAEGFIKIWGLPIETASRKSRCPSRSGGALNGASLVRTVRRRSRRGAVRVRRVIPIRSPPVRRRCDREPRLGGSARARRRAVACRTPRRFAQRSRTSRRRADSDPAFFTSPAAALDEDVHSFVERELVARVGDAGRRLHTGRSRNEQVSLDLRLYLKRRIPLLQRRIAALVRVLADQAERVRAGADAVVHASASRAAGACRAFLPGACRGVPARPLAASPLLLIEADELPLGSGAIAGTSYPIDVQALAATLGFSRIVANSIDATGDRDFVASFLHASALTMVHLSRLAEDCILFTSEEFGFFELADTAATGSSLMPQKKNPDPLELVRGKAGRVIGHLAGWLATMKGLPIGYNKDLQEDKEALFDAEDTVGASLDATAVSGCRSEDQSRARPRRRHQDCCLPPTSPIILSAKGMPFREAHEVVGALVRRLLDEARRSIR